jgi:phosphosulfolactate synthase
MAEKRKAERAAWEGAIEQPVQGRLGKPRQRGWTIVVDRGLGLNAVDDLMQVAAPVIDVVKLGSGTSALLGYDLLREKVRTITAHGVACMPGGALLQVAIWQGALDRYLDRARELGFTAIEVSDDRIEVDAGTRAEAIEKAVKAGFRVLAEVGRKDPGDVRLPAVLADLAKADLERGACMVIVAGDLAGKDVGLDDASGLPKETELAALLAVVRGPDRILWEAPLDSQQRDLVRRFGANVNLGGVAPEDVLALEALRCGLRGDTLRRAWLGDRDWRGPSGIAVARSAEEV